MSDLDILRQKNPQQAKALELWRQKYEGRKYDFGKPEDQADYYEALTELAKLITRTSVSALLSTRCGEQGFVLESSAINRSGISLTG